VITQRLLLDFLDEPEDSKRYALRSTGVNLFFFIFMLCSYCLLIQFKTSTLASDLFSLKHCPTTCLTYLCPHPTHYLFFLITKQHPSLEILHFINTTLLGEFIFKLGHSNICLIFLYPFMFLKSLLLFCSVITYILQFNSCINFLVNFFHFSFVCSLFLYWSLC